MSQEINNGNISGNNVNAPQPTSILICDFVELFNTSNGVQHQLDPHHQFNRHQLTNNQHQLDQLNAQNHSFNSNLQQQVQESDGVNWCHMVNVANQIHAPVNSNVQNANLINPNTLNSIDILEFHQQWSQSATPPTTTNIVCHQQQYIDPATLTLRMIDMGNEHGSSNGQAAFIHQSSSSQSSLYPVVNPNDVLTPITPCNDQHSNQQNSARYDIKHKFTACNSPITMKSTPAPIFSQTNDISNITPNSTQYSTATSDISTLTTSVISSTGNFVDGNNSKNQLSNNSNTNRTDGVLQFSSQKFITNTSSRRVNGHKHVHRLAKERAKMTGRERQRELERQEVHQIQLRDYYKNTIMQLEQKCNKMREILRSLVLSSPMYNEQVIEQLNSLILD